MHLYATMWAFRRSVAASVMIVAALALSILVLAQDDRQDAVPANLVAEIVEEGIQLRWEAPVDDADSVTGYEVLGRHLQTGEVFLREIMAITGSEQNSYLDRTEVEEGVRYLYWVRALREESSGEWSSYIAVEPEEEEAEEAQPAVVVDFGIEPTAVVPEEDVEPTAEVKFEATEAGREAPAAPTAAGEARPEPEPTRRVSVAPAKPTVARARAEQPAPTRVSREEAPAPTAARPEPEPTRAAPVAPARPTSRPASQPEPTAAQPEPQPTGSA